MNKIANIIVLIGLMTTVIAMDMYHPTFNNYEYMYRDSFGSIAISDMCLESYPCQHEVMIDGQTVGFWDGRRIYEYISERNISIPHFDVYKQVKHLH